MSYMGQFEILCFDSAFFQVSNSVFFLGDGKFGGGLTNSSSFKQINTNYMNNIGISMTLGLLEEASYFSQNCRGGVELIVTDSTIVEIDSTNWSLLWFSFDEDANAEFNFPVQNSSFSYASDVSYFSFSDSLSGVSGVDYNVIISNSDKEGGRLGSLSSSQKSRKNFCVSSVLSLDAIFQEASSCERLLILEEVISRAEEMKELKENFLVGGGSAAAAI